MIKLSQLLEKQLIDKKDNRALGAVTGVSIDPKTGKCFAVNDHSCFDIEKLTVSDNILIAENPQETHVCGLLNLEKKLYDVNGKFLGNINEVEMRNNLKFLRIESDRGEYYTKGRIKAVGDIVLVNLPKKVIRKKVTSNDNSLQETSCQEKNSQSIKFPNEYKIKRRYGDFSFLIGKTVDKNITNFYGETMLKNGERITADSLRQAKLSGKLIELCLHAK